MAQTGISRRNLPLQREPDTQVKVRTGGGRRTHPRAGGDEPSRAPGPLPPGALI